MKKSLLALAVLGAFAGAASAQSSVTLYGIIDANLGKSFGSSDKRMDQGAQSRLGVRGVEDLGGGLAAVFQFEHRFDSGTGQQLGQLSTAAAPGTNAFWQARSYVGLQGGFGKILLGREYTQAFWQQLAADPWGYDTVASSLTAGFAGGGVANNRLNNAVTYSIAAAGFSFGAQIAEANTNGSSSVTTNAAKKPFNLAAAYDIGGLSVGVAYENPGDADDKWTVVRASYKFGAVKVGGLYGTGTQADTDKVKSYLLTVTADVGAGQIRAAYGDRKVDPVGAVGSASDMKGFALGYHHAVSKRTTLYVDYANNSKLATEKNAYDFGVKHAF
jgi:predicted porin